MFIVKNNLTSKESENKEYSYYVGGMIMPGRKFGGLGRYGFNGKEQDSSINGTGVDYDYGARILDVRIGPRFLSVDPLQRKYANESPYLYTGGNPILFVDQDGKDKIEYIKVITDKATVLIRKVTAHEFEAHADASYNGGYIYYKSDVIVNTTYDLRSGVPQNKIYSSTTQVAGASKSIGFGEYLKIKVLGRDNKLQVQLPQVMVFGSGVKDPTWGSQADPNRPITTIDFSTFNKIIGLAMTGMSVPDLKGADVQKIPGLIDKARKIVISEQQNGSDNIRTSSSNQYPPNSQIVLFDNEANLPPGIGYAGKVSSKSVRTNSAGKVTDTIIEYNRMYVNPKPTDTVPAQ